MTPKLFWAYGLGGALVFLLGGLSRRAGNWPADDPGYVVGYLTASLVGGAILGIVAGYIMHGRAEQKT